MADALPLRGAGLGLRRALLDELIEAPAGAFDFLECAPDNWIGVGGVLGDKLQALASLMLSAGAKRRILLLPAVRNTTLLR